MKGAYTPELTPVGRRGDVLLLDDGDSTQRVEVEKVTVYPQTELEPVTVVDGSQEEVEATRLEMWDGWLGQFRLSRVGDDIPDGVSIEVDQGGRQAPLYQTKEQRGVVEDGTAAITAETASGSTDVVQTTHLLEYYVHEQEVPYFTYINNSGAEQDITLTFSGFGLKLQQPQNARNKTEIHVPVESIRSV